MSDEPRLPGVPSTSPFVRVPARVHFAGVAGAGMSALARLLARAGHDVSGHDRASSDTTTALLQEGVRVRVGPSTADELPADVGLLVRSAAVPEDDPQVARARAQGVPSVKYAELLGRMAPAERTLAVAGTHGKTTTTWMLWYSLEGVRGDLAHGPAPGLVAGGVSRDIGTNAVQPEPGGWFAVEACEYDRSFLRLSPFGAVVTNVEGDHLDYYGTLDAVEEAFARFCSRVSGKGLVVLGRNVPERVEHAARCTVWRLGRELDFDLLGERRGCFRFRLRGPGWCVPEAELFVPGEFNVENAALAVALAVGVGIPGSAAPATPPPGAEPARGLKLFRGVGRRYETWGEEGGVVVVHDYAHHPTEVRVVLEAARRTHPGVPLHVLFQPHQHSRTARFLDEFCEALRSADRVVVSDVYGARSHIDGTRHAGAPELVAGLQARRVDALHGGALGPSTERFCAGLPASALALVIGAGDIETIRHDLLDELALRRAVRRGPVR